MCKKLNLLNFNKDLIYNFCINLGCKKYVANQIIYWIYKKYCFNFFLMTSLNFILRKKLASLAEIRLPKIVKEYNSLDGVIKWLLSIDNYYIETVYIPEVNRKTLCLSTQIGCLVNCSFCFSSKSKFKRNLLVSEIIGQILLVSFLLKKRNISPITNIVLMGIGEPLLNFNNVVDSIKIMLDPNYFGFSKRKIVLSTSGIVPGIYKLVNVIDIVLVLSLHASNDLLRNQIMPINEKFNIKSIIKAILFYLNYSKANRGNFNIEYIMLNNINDKYHNAYELVSLFNNIPVKINLIPFNKFKNSMYTESSLEKIKNFCEILKRNKIFSFIRKTRGSDINASCGQLSSDI